MSTEGFASLWLKHLDKYFVLNHLKFILVNLSLNCDKSKSVSISFLLEYKKVRIPFKEFMKKYLQDKLENDIEIKTDFIPSLVELYVYCFAGEKFIYMDLFNLYIRKFLEHYNIQKQLIGVNLLKYFIFLEKNCDIRCEELEKVIIVSDSILSTKVFYILIQDNLYYIFRHLMWPRLVFCSKLDQQNDKGCVL